MRRRIVFAIGIVVSAVFLWLALRDTDFSAIRSALAAANQLFAIPFLLCLFAFYWLKSVRWRYLLSSAVESRTGDLFPIVMIGYAGTAVLPMQMGELVRAYILGKRYSVPFSLSLSSIGLERVFDLLTILALLGLLLASGQSTPDALTRAGYVIGAVTLLAMAFTFVLVLRTEQTLAALRRLLVWAPTRLSELILKQFEAASLGLASVKSPRLFFRVAVNSALQWALMGVCVWCSLTALDLQVPIAAVVLVLVATIVGISLPTSPGYVGNIQLAFVVALQPFDISTSEAIAASVFYHVLAYLAVVVVGFTFAHRMGYGMFDIQAEAQASTKPSPE